MDLETLVAPLELCRQIPRGCFEDSALVWGRPCNVGVLVGDDDLWSICGRSKLEDDDEMLPAPTFEEIMREMAEYPHRFNNLTCDAYAEDDFGVAAFIPYRGKAGARLTECRDKSAAAAALKLYLFRIEE